LFVLGSVAYSALSEPERDETGEIVESGVLGVFDVQVGDCLVEPSGEGNIEEFETLPCEDTHDLEVFALVDHPDESSADYPGEASITDWGGEECYQRFEGYVGASWESSLDLNYFFVYPSEDAWSQGERELICSVAPFVEGDQLTGSMKGVGPSAIEEKLGTIDLFDLSVGDCFDEAGAAAVVFDVLTKSCSGLHEFEVYALPAHPAGATQAFPGENDLDKFGESMCGEEFGQSVDAPPGQNPDLAFYYLYPTAESWLFGERVVICFLGTVSGKQIVGPLSTAT
jgi:hypothetical protein